MRHITNLYQPMFARYFIVYPLIILVLLLSVSSVKAAGFYFHSSWGAGNCSTAHLCHLSCWYGRWGDYKSSSYSGGQCHCIDQGDSDYYRGVVKNFCPDPYNVECGGDYATCTLGHQTCSTSGQFQDQIEGICKSPAMSPNLGAPEKNSCDVQTGNPVNIGIGNKFLNETDYTNGGPVPIAFERYYNSAAEGTPWTHNYNRSIVTVDVDNVDAVRADGKVKSFQRSCEGCTDWIDGTGKTGILDALPGGVGWTYTTDNNTVETYNSIGQLETITYLNGGVLTITYAAGSGLLETVSASSGESLDFTYNVSNRISAVTDHAGRVWGYRYDAVDNIEYVNYPAGTTKQYHYEDTNFPGALTGITDENGIRHSTYSYDTEGRAVMSALAGDVERIDIAYGEHGERIVTNSQGVATTYSAILQNGITLMGDISGPGCAACSEGDTSNEYDDFNNLTARTEKGIRTEWGSYDSKGNAGYMIEAAGTAEARRTDYTYDARFQSKAATQTAPSVYATGNKVTTYSYDDFGNITAVTISGFKPDGSPVSATTTMQYSGPLNQLSQVDGPRSDVSDVTTLFYHPYDASPVAFAHDNGRLLSVVVGNGIVIRDNLQYSNTGQLISEQRPNGLTYTYTYYPGNDRLETLTESDGTTQRTTRWRYLASGEVETITTDDGTPNATTLTLGYDAARRLTSVTDALGHRLTYTLDTEGNITAQENHDDLSVLRQTLTQTFDAYNRLESRVGAAAQTTTFGYDANGNLESRIDANNISSSYTYDNLQRLTSVSNAPGDLSSYVYDVNDNLNQVIDPNGNTTVYQYDDLGNLIQLTSPDTGITTYSGYDGAGNAAQMTDANGNTTSYQYDALNRLTLATYQDGTTTQYSYEDVATNAVGRLSTITDLSGTTRYQYSTFGDVTQLSQTVGTQALVTDYAYDTAGYLDLITYPSGTVVDYDYFAGRISEIKINGTSLLNTIHYYPFGPAESWTWGNATPTTRSFDLDGQMSQYSLNGDSQSLVYDPAGNLQTRSNTLGSLTYGYDDLNRLTGVTGLQSQAFAYDNNGNRTQLIDGADVSSYTVAANSNRITEITGVQAKLYGYDNNGNILSDGTNSFTYNARNRMASANGVGYLHNGLGQRVAKIRQNAMPGDASNDGVINQADFDQTVTAILEAATPVGNTDCNQDGQTNVIDLVCLNNLIAIATPPQEIINSTYFAYDLQGQLIGEYGNDGSAIQETVYFDNMPVATIKQGAVYYIHTDQLNTPRVISDVNNVTLWQWESTPFGETAANEDVDGDGTSFEYGLRFPGQYFDEETGLHYNYFRDYDPVTGRYTTSDPIGLAGGLNTYAYALQNPIRYTDPEGLLAAKVIEKAKKVWDDLEFEGIKPSRKKDGTGQFCQIKFKKKPIFRIDIHPIDSQDRTPVLHFHIAPDMKKHRDLPTMLRDPIKNIIQKKSQGGGL
jgi:RHS repeat-associated protein